LGSLSAERRASVHKNLNCILMKSKIYLLILFSALAIVFACQPEPTDSLSIAFKLQGHWQCDEISSIYKSTNSIYYVNIDIYPTDSNKIVITNFYGLGNNVDVTARINGMSIDIPSQTTDGSTFTGSGLIAKDFNTINWSYTVDIGDGSIDEVTATYTRINN
jgi:hypothetical protein